jgi:poly-gamma-glutamate synthesis protein (capsule biosynthesis protein)
VEIIIGSDLVPTESNYELFNNADVDALIGIDLNSVLSEADYRIFNLEVPLTNVETPISKCGPNLISSPSTIEGIKALGVDFLTLANNHILDQGKQGLYSTINILSKHSFCRSWFKS